MNQLPLQTLLNVGDLNPTQSTIEIGDKGDFPKWWHLRQCLTIDSRLGQVLGRLGRRAGFALGRAGDLLY